MERLLAKGCFGQGQTLAMAATVAETRYQARMIPFTVHKVRRPKGE